MCCHGGDGGCYYVIDLRNVFYYGGSGRFDLGGG